MIKKNRIKDLKKLIDLYILFYKDNILIYIHSNIEVFYLMYYVYKIKKKLNLC